MGCGVIERHLEMAQPTKKPTTFIINCPNLKCKQGQHLDAGIGVTENIHHKGKCWVAGSAGLKFNLIFL